MKCDFNCDDCKRTLCTQGNPTIEPTEEEIQETLDTLANDFFNIQTERKATQWQKLS